jgi:hypothetical protein
LPRLVWFVPLLVLPAVLWALGAWPFRAAAPAPVPPPAAPAPGQPWFEEVSEARGVSFRHFDPATPRHLIQETMGSGLAWIDYDNDGWPDLFCVQVCAIGSEGAADAPASRLYRNNGDGTFRDVTGEVGLDCRDFGTGVAVGDFDNDGFDDLAVASLGGVRLFHNRAKPGGGRRFVDVTAASKIENPHWATSCAWGDIDGDGLLDLYVCNYVETDPKNPLVCRHPERGLYYQCSPTAYPLARHRLYRNKGGGEFEDVTTSSGVAAASPAPGLGVVMVDLDGDGLLDIYVANDMHPAYLFHNQGGGKFVEKALPSGCGLGPAGARVAGMGVVAADLDGSGRPSLFVTNFQKEPNVLFRNRGGLRFEEASGPSGLGPPSLSKLGFGTVPLDADLDGTTDLAIANGHVHRTAPELFGVPYAQEAQLFLGDGRGKFRDVSAGTGPDFSKPRVGRGLAAADFDNDGRPDLALSGVGEPVALLRNATPTENAWVSLDIVGDGVKSNRNAVGAVVSVEAGGRTQTFFVVGGGSYLSASDRRLLVGLGAAAKVSKVTVRFPSGRRQVYENLPARTWWRLLEGKDAPEPVAPLRP